MLRSSLAQFEWPDDHSGAEYLAREKKYWTLRKDLERRYPQVCSECEPKVEKKLHDASYTAQTDHLKRMIQRTRSRRDEVRRKGLLDMLDIVGKWSWKLSYILQFLWHAATLSALLVQQFEPVDDKTTWMALAVRILRRVAVDSFHDSDRLLSWAINLGLCSFPWNPRFKQSIRGFTLHILGFKQWYSYQLLTLLVRLVCLSITQYAETQNITASAQLGAQIFIAVFMAYVSILKSCPRTRTPAANA